MGELLRPSRDRRRFVAHPGFGALWGRTRRRGRRVGGAGAGANAGAATRTRTVVGRPMNRRTAPSLQDARVTGRAEGLPTGVAGRQRGAPYGAPRGERKGLMSIRSNAVTRYGSANAAKAVPCPPREAISA